MNEDEEQHRVVVIDPLNLALTTIGALICLTTLHTHLTQATANLTGIAFILVANLRFIVIPFVLKDVTQGAFRVWRIIFILHTLFIAVAVARALAYLAFNG